MCTIALAKVQRNYNCYNVYFYECLLFIYALQKLTFIECLLIKFFKKIRPCNFIVKSQGQIQLTKQVYSIYLL